MISFLLQAALAAAAPVGVTTLNDIETLASAKVLYEEQCAECHGYNGVSPIDRYPNVAKQKELYLAQELRNFKSGYRNGAIMPEATADLTEEEIDSISKYMSRLKGK